MFYDPMICKLTCYGATREDAIATSVNALDHYVIRGEIYFKLIIIIILMSIIIIILISIIIIILISIIIIILIIIIIIILISIMDLKIIYSGDKKN